MTQLSFPISRGGCSAFPRKAEGTLTYTLNPGTTEISTLVLISILFAVSILLYSRRWKGGLPPLGELQFYPVTGW